MSSSFTRVINPFYQIEQPFTERRKSLMQWTGDICSLAAKVEKVKRYIKCADAF